MLEARFFPRTNVDLAATLTTNATISCRVVNLSEEGALISGAHEVRGGVSGELRIEVPTRLTPITIGVKVLRTIATGQAALQITDIEESELSALRSVLEQRSDIAWEGGNNRIPREVAVRLVPMIRRLARGIAQRLPPQVSVDDLVGAGFVALVELYAKHLDIPLADFERMAMPRIRWAMMDELRNADPLSRRMRQRARRIAKASRDLQHELGRKPTHSEVAARLQLSPESYGTALRLAHSGEPTSLDAMEDMELADTHAAGPEELMNRTESLAQLRTGLDALPPRLKRVLELYYGDDLTLRQIGNLLGVTEARISQLLSDAVQRLRKSCNSDRPTMPAATITAPPIALHGARSSRRRSSAPPRRVAA